MGVESGAQKILDAMDKGTRVEQVRDGDAPPPEPRHPRRRGSCSSAIRARPGRTSSRRAISSARSGRTTSEFRSSTRCPARSSTRRVKEQLGAPHELERQRRPRDDVPRERTRGLSTGTCATCCTRRSTAYTSPGDDGAERRKALDERWCELDAIEGRHSAPRRPGRRPTRLRSASCPSEGGDRRDVIRRDAASLPRGPRLRRARAPLRRAAFAAGRASPRSGAPSDARSSTRFPRGRSLIELGGGTGEDALFLAERGPPRPRHGRSARDGGARRARRRAPRASRTASRRSASRSRSSTRGRPRAEAATFDGAFSNFASLNCVTDHASVAHGLARLLPPGRRALLVVFGPCCPGEMLVLLARGRGAGRVPELRALPRAGARRAASRSP